MDQQHLDIDLEKPEKKDNYLNSLFIWIINRNIKYLRC